MFGPLTGSWQEEFCECFGSVTGPSMDDREIRSASGAARSDSGAGREGGKVARCGTAGTVWILTDDDVRVAGELTSIRARRCAFGDGRNSDPAADMSHRARIAGSDRP
jgi:hypothetical protein